MNVSRLFPLVLLLPTLLAAAPAAEAAPAGGDAWCATHPARLAVALARHQSHQRQLERAVARQSGLLPQAPIHVSRYDQIAVIEDNGTIIDPPRPFDLAGQSIQFLRRPKGMSAVRSNVGYKELIGTRRPMGDDSVTPVVFTNGLEFPFFDRVHTSVWVSSNGYLVFDLPDPQRPPDDVFDLLGGPPVIAPFGADLDPSAATGDGGVYVDLQPRRARFTWFRVPESGTHDLVTAQVTLFENGRILFAYGDVAASSGIVGIFPGGEAEADAYHLDFTVELPQPPRRTALFETFIDEVQVDEPALVEAFYEHFQDRYDQLVVWFDFPLATGDGDGAFQLTLKNDVRGLGMPTYDASRLFGLERLESYVQMGYLGQYPDDPDAVVFETNSTMDLLAHQVGHRWLGLVTYRSQEPGIEGAEVLNLLDWPISEHWSFYFDTERSFLGGNEIRDNGDGTFTTMGATSKYCPLDLYLMGLAPAEEVANFFYVKGATERPNWAVPEIGVTLRGHRVDVGMWQVTEALGPRAPSFAEAPKVFNMAFVLLAREGEPPSAESLAKLNDIRSYWHTFFREATDFHGRVSTALRNE